MKPNLLMFEKLLSVTHSVLSTLSNLYQPPEILPPLDNDPEKNGKPSDHNIVVVEPISELKSNCARQVRKVIVRPTPETKL